MFIDSRNSLCALASSAFSLAASAKTANCYFSYLSVWYLWVSAAMHTYITHLYKPLISYNMCSLCKLEPIKMWDIMSACWTRDKDAAKSRIIWDAWPPYPQPIVLHARYVGGMRVYGSIDVKEIPSSFFIYFVQHKSSIDIFITLQETVSLNLCPHSRAITFPLNAYLFLWLCLLLLACLTTFFFASFFLACIWLPLFVCRPPFLILVVWLHAMTDIAKPRKERQISFQWPLKIGQDEHKKWFSHTLKQTTHLQHKFKNDCIVP